MAPSLGPAELDRAALDALSEAYDLLRAIGRRALAEQTRCNRPAKTVEGGGAPVGETVAPDKEEERGKAPSQSAAGLYSLSRRGA
jgi:hypothetical protein